MLTLAIDTSGEFCAIALGRGPELVCEYHFHHKMTLLRRLVPNIERMLADAGRAAQDIEGIVVSLGPGSFTGLRIGVTTAKSIAYAVSKPIVGVGTLDALARGVAHCGAELICPMIHARADEVYWCIFDSSGELRLAEYEVSSVDDALDSVAARGVSVGFCGSGAARNAELIEGRFGDAALIGEAWTAFVRGAALIDIGYRKLREGAVDDAFALTPLYIRKPTPVVRLQSG